MASPPAARGLLFLLHPHQHWLISALKIMPVLVAEMAHLFFRVAAEPGGSTQPLPADWETEALGLEAGGG